MYDRMVSQYDCPCFFAMLWNTPLSHWLRSRGSRQSHEWYNSRATAISLMGLACAFSFSKLALCSLVNWGFQVSCRLESLNNDVGWVVAGSITNSVQNLLCHLVTHQKSPSSSPYTNPRTKETQQAASTKTMIAKSSTLLGSFRCSSIGVFRLFITLLCVIRLVLNIFIFKYCIPVI